MTKEESFTNLILFNPKFSIIQEAFNQGWSRSNREIIQIMYEYRYNRGCNEIIEELIDRVYKL